MFSARLMILASTTALVACGTGGGGNAGGNAATGNEGADTRPTTPDTSSGSNPLPGGGGSTGLPPALPTGDCVPGCSSGFSCVDHACVRTAPQVCSPECTAGWTCNDGVCEPAELATNHLSGGASWTVLVYMAADNDLEPFAVLDLEEMMEVGSSQGFRIVVQVDRADKCYSDNPQVCRRDARFRGGFTQTKRFVVGQGKLEELADLGETDTGTADSLADFIAWGATAYPADQMALMLWDHGGGWTGYATDNESNSGLSLEEVRSAISGGLQAADRDHFTLIGFDACFMAAYEVAATLRPYGEYLLASEEYEPGHGWDWTALAAARDNPGIPATDLAQRIADGFLKQAKEWKTEAAVTLSTVDLLAIDAVSEALAGLGSAVTAGDPNTVVSFGRARAWVTRFGKDADPKKDRHIVDLGDLAARLGARGIGAAAALEKAIDAAVLHEISGSGVGAAHGLSLYFPPSAQLYNKTYDEIAAASSWSKVLRTYYQSGSQVEGEPQYSVGTSLTVAGSGIDAAATLTSASAASVVSVTSLFGAEVGESAVMVAGVPGSLSGEEINVAWDGNVLVATQGSTRGYVFYMDYAGEGGPTSDLTFAQDDGSLATLRYTPGTAGGAGSFQWYQQSEGGSAEWTPQSGETVRPVLLVYDSNGSHWQAQETYFDASGELTFTMESMVTAADAGVVVGVICATSVNGAEACSGATIDLGGGTDGQTDGVVDGNTDGGTDGNTDGGTDGNTDGGTGAECTPEALVGECIGTTLFYCEEGVELNKACAAGEICDFDAAGNEGVGWYDCMPDGTIATCAPEDEVGYCLGNTLYYCQDGENLTMECDANEVCAFEPGGNNGLDWYNCLSADGSPTGTTCPAILDCAYACPVDDATCPQACYDAGTDAAKALFMDVNDCDTLFNCGYDATCLSPYCPDQYTACLADG